MKLNCSTVTAWLLSLALALVLLPGGGTSSAAQQPGITASPHAPNAALIGQIGGSAYAVAVQGHYAYIGVGPRLVIVDISNPAQPIVVGQTRVLPNLISDIALAGSYAYIANSDSGLRIINMSDPTQPVEVGFYDTPGSAGGVAVMGSYAYIADGYFGLRIVNVSNPANPYEVGFYDTPGDALGVAVAGS